MLDLKKLKIIKITKCLKRDTRDGINGALLKVCVKFPESYEWYDIYARLVNIPVSDSPLESYMLHTNAKDWVFSFTLAQAEYQWYNYTFYDNCKYYPKIWEPKLLDLIWGCSKKAKKQPWNSCYEYICHFYKAAEKKYEGALRNFLNVKNISNPINAKNYIRYTQERDIFCKNNKLTDFCSYCSVK
jgi:hypothetical protein